MLAGTVMPLVPSLATTPCFRLNLSSISRSATPRSRRTCICTIVLRSRNSRPWNPFLPSASNSDRAATSARRRASSAPRVELFRAEGKSGPVPPLGGACASEGDDAGAGRACDEGL
ncbi:predicted protein [Verticillium alfalfae VaMs.102]|uniref:Predicted protein n=1 Tax=Verticillium alfalfae (strain VaMs.102 / ATCC MYA-4576 / FGSC 10136) TaxID=526221 RepID=C9SF41_VERA1|nr:predicted protein [Verticillium alfalfae VaMs.102]EEY17827.1 predicted protein [Verticillium alfalfae VaMs.102]